MTEIVCLIILLLVLIGIYEDEKYAIQKFLTRMIIVTENLLGHITYAEAEAALERLESLDLEELEG